MSKPMNVLSIAVVGVLGVFGGEAFCILGPMQWQIHVICHAIFYAGVGLVVLAGVLHWKGRRK